MNILLRNLVKLHTPKVIITFFFGRIKTSYVLLLFSFSFFFSFLNFKALKTRCFKATVSSPIRSFYSFHLIHNDIWSIPNVSKPIVLCPSLMITVDSSYMVLFSLNLHLILAFVSIIFTMNQTEVLGWTMLGT